MESQLLIMIVDPDDPKRVEITSVDSTAQAARMVETMLEAGFDQSRIKIFEGTELEMQVAHRPVVSLVTQDEPGAYVAPPPAQNVEVAVDTTVDATIDAAEVQSDDEPSGDDEEPFVQNGVRFSSLFKPAQ